MQSWDEIRKILIEHGKKDPENAFHVISNLNWFRFEKQVNRLLNSVPQNAKVLELGCGWGHIAAMISYRRPDVKITATDLKRTETWENFRERVNYQVCDATDLSRFPDNSFDVVYSFGVLEHVSNPNKFLKEAHRVLKPNGRLFIFNLPNKFAAPEITAKYLGLFYHDVRYTMREAKQLIKSNGFSCIYWREFVIPAQVDRVSPKLGKFFNKHYKGIDRLDNLLIHTPLCFICEALGFECTKI